MARLIVTLCALQLAALLPAALATVWDKCDLASDLIHKYNLPQEQINTWLCIAFRESRYDSSHINIFNTDGSKDYGLFQINNRYWCNNENSPQPNQNMCNVKCGEVMTNMDATVRCIKIMYAKSKNSWQPWITYPYCLKMDMSQFSKGCDLSKNHYLMRAKVNKNKRKG